MDGCILVSTDRQDLKSYLLDIPPLRSMTDYSIKQVRVVPSMSLQIIERDEFVRMPAIIWLVNGKVC